MIALTFSRRRLKLVKLGYHVVFKHVEVPESHEKSDPTNEHALHTTDIWQEVKESVDVPGNDLLVEIHLDSDVHLHDVVFLVGHNRQLLEIKKGVVVQRSESVKADWSHILQGQRSRADAKGGYLPDLGVHGQPHNSTLVNDRVFTKVACIKANLVKYKQEELVFQKLGYFCVWLAVWSVVASHQLHVELASLVRVVVAEEFEVLFVHALELLLVKIDFVRALLIHRHEHGIRAVLFNA